MTHFESFRINYQDIHEFTERYEVELIIFQIEMAEIVLSRRSVTGQRQQTRGRGQKLD